MISKQAPLGYMKTNEMPLRISTVGNGRRARLKIAPLTGRDLRRAVIREQGKSK